MLRETFALSMHRFAAHGKYERHCQCTPVGSIWPAAFPELSRQIACHFAEYLKKSLYIPALMEPGPYSPCRYGTILPFSFKTAQKKRLLSSRNERGARSKAISQRYSKNVNLKICLGLPLGTFSIPAISTKSLSVHSWSSRCALRTVMSSR